MRKCLIIMCALTAASLLHAGTLSSLGVTLGLANNTFDPGEVDVYNNITQPYVHGTIATYASWGQMDILSDTEDGMVDVDVVLEIFWTRSSPNEIPPSHALVTYQLGSAGSAYASVSGSTCSGESLANVVIPPSVNRTTTANQFGVGTDDDEFVLQWTTDRQVSIPLEPTGDPNVYRGVITLFEVATIQLQCESLAVFGNYHEAYAQADGYVKFKAISAVEEYQ